MKRFNVYSKSGKIIDRNVTADYVKDEYDCSNPWRYAIKNMLLHGKYLIREVEE